MRAIVTHVLAATAILAASSAVSYAQNEPSRPALQALQSEFQDIGDFADLIALIGRGANLSYLTGINDVTLVSVESQLTDYRADALAQALSNNAPQISAMRLSIGPDTSLGAYLQSYQVDPGSVVAIKLARSGALVVYTSDQ